MMESPPASPLEVRQAQFALQFLVVAFDAPSQLDDIDQNRERRVPGQGREPVFRRLRLALRPFDDEPLDGMGLHELVIALSPAGRARRRSAKTKADWSLHAARRPSRGGQAHRKLFGRDGSMLGVVS